METLIYGIISIIVVGLSLVGIACVMMAGRNRTAAEIAEDDDEQREYLRKLGTGGNK